MRWMMTIGITAATSLITSAWAIVPGKVLFDATKAEMCANADWVIDADTYNIGTGSTGLMVVGSGSEANPGRYPTPAASGITASTSETYWKGALSAWAVSLVKLGFSVETLPLTGRITYGDATNVFGITFNLNTVSLTSSYVDTLTTDPLIRGAAGTVTRMKYSSGATLAITGSNVRGAIFQTSAKSSGSTMVAYATYGAGKVVACGDSSPFDDGTGDTNDTLYTGWSGDVSGDHGKLALNACLWLDPAPQCPSDLDGDGKVGSADIALALLDFGACSGCSSDLDSDGKVGNSDVALILLDFGPCP